MVKARGIFKGDLVIWIVYFFLIAISLVEEFSAASSLAYKSGDYWGVFYNHATMLFLGFVVMWIIHNIPCRWFKVVPLFGLTIVSVALICTLIFGHTSNEGARWLNVFGIQIQPSEFAKPIIVTTVALFLSFNQREKSADPRVFNKILIVTGFICLLILTQNFSTAALIFCVVYMMMIVGRVPTGLMVKLTATAIGSVLLMFLLLASLPQDSRVFDWPGFGRAKTWKNRIFNYTEDKKKKDAEFRQAEALAANPDKADSIKAANYPITEKENAQVGHANIAIASAHIIGKGPGNSVQRDFLSQAFSDFIFAIIIEELGILGAIGVILLYVILLFRAARIANRCERNFPAFLILGLALYIVFQALLNMAVAVGLMPVTGQTLPLISRGGSSILSISISLGMILSVSRYARKRTNAQSATTNEDPAVTAYFQDNGTME